MEKCYNVTVTGKVHDISFRSLIEDIARFLGLKGFAFNDIDGSVKMVCCGERSVIINFLKEISIRGEQKGVIIDDINKEEIPFHIFLPEKFSRLYTDEIADLGRKMDIGNRKLDAAIDVLRDIKTDTSVLSSFVVEQRVHNQHLENILEKLAEK